MKRYFISLCILLFITGTAYAIPFQVSNSSLNINWNNGGGIVSYAGNSMSSAINLDPGDSFMFDFGQIFFPLAWGSGTADLNVQFSTPQFINPVQDQASFSVWSLFFISGGNLAFGAPSSFAYTHNGTSGFMILDLIDLSGIQLGSWANIKGTITNAGTSATAPVPEPATLLLLGTGLLGIAGIGRTRLLKTS